MSDLVGAIDAERQHGNLSSAIRLFVLDHYQARPRNRTEAARPDHGPAAAGVNSASRIANSTTSAGSAAATAGWFRHSPSACRRPAARLAPAVCSRQAMMKRRRQRWKRRRRNRGGGNFRAQAVEFVGTRRQCCGCVRVVVDFQRRAARHKPHGRRRRTDKVAQNVSAPIGFERFETPGLLLGRPQRQPSDQSRHVEFPLRRRERPPDADGELRPRADQRVRRRLAGQRHLRIDRRIVQIEDAGEQQAPPRPAPATSRWSAGLPGGDRHFRLAFRHRELAASMAALTTARIFAASIVPLWSARRIAASNAAGLRPANCARVSVIVPPP